MHNQGTHILLYTVILITSLLVLLMMLWHVSTAHLIDKYGMPQKWYDEFIKAQFPGWRIGLWVLLFFMIPLNCIHALLCLDFYAGRIYPRGRSPRISTEVPERLNGPQVDGGNNLDTATIATGHQTRSSSAQQRHSFLPSHIPMPSQQQTTFTPHASPTYTIPSKFPSTSHPFLSPGIPASLRFLPTLYDIVMILLLLFHILIFLTSLHSNMEYCNWKSKEGIAQPWDLTSDDESTAAATKSDMSLYDRCVRINIDNWISGGFDIGLCLLLLCLHVLLVLMRAWELFLSCDGKNEMGGAKDNEDGIEMNDLRNRVRTGDGDGDGDGDVEATVQSMDGMIEDYVSREQAGYGITAGKIIPVADNFPTPAVPYRSGRERRNMASSGVSERKGQKWTLLECLVGDG